jgi:glycerophosphoryl diester phosphodiesterase
MNRRMNRSLFPLPTAEPSDPLAQARHLHGLPGPVVVAHRAANSLVTLRAAEGIGVDVVEADVWLHRGRLEVRHSKTAGPLPVLWDRWSLERLPAAPFELAALLEALTPGTRLMLDLKGNNQRLPDAVACVRREVLPDQRLLVCSQNWAQLERFRPYPNIDLVHSIGNRRQLAFAWGRLAGSGFDAVSIHARMLTPDLVARLQRLVSGIITWPINTPAQLRHVLDLGVDGFTSDNLTLMQTFLETRGASDERRSPGDALR